MCNVPTSQVHETGEVEASWVDPQSWKIHRLSTWSRRADPAMWDPMCLQEMYDLGWPYHITSHHSMSTWAKAPAKWLPFTSFTGFHRFHRPSRANSSIDAGVGREPTATSWWGAPCDRVFRWPSSSCCSTPQWALRGHEIPISSTM